MNLISSNELTMNSLDISELVESRHDKVKQSIERLVKREVISQPPMGDGPKSANGTVTKVYLIGKRDSYIIVAQLSPEFTARLVDRWQELESNLPSIPQTYAEALQLAADQAKQIEQQQTIIAEQTPKVEFYNDVTGSTDTVSMSEVAKVLNIKGMGRNKLFQFLRDESVLQHNNEPYQCFVDRGYFRIVESKYSKPAGSTHISLKTVVYQKGLDYIRKLLQKSIG